MSDRSNGSPKSMENTYYYKSVWTKTPTGDYSGEPNYLSADVFNLLINEMQTNKNNLAVSPKVLSGVKTSLSVSIPGYVGSGTKYSAADWNNVCNQVATLISDTKRVLENVIHKANLINVSEVNNFRNQMRNVINVSESEAYALRYSSGELISSAKTLTRLINIVRRARIHCTCHAEYYRPNYSYSSNDDDSRHNCRDRERGEGRDDR